MDSVAQEFGQKATEIACLCATMSGVSAGKTQTAGGTPMAGDEDHTETSALTICPPG